MAPTYQTHTPSLTAFYEAIWKFGLGTMLTPFEVFSKRFDKHEHTWSKQKIHNSHGNKQTQTCIEQKKIWLFLWSDGLALLKKETRKKTAWQKWRLSRIQNWCRISSILFHLPKGDPPKSFVASIFISVIFIFFIWMASTNYSSCVCKYISWQWSTTAISRLTRVARWWGKAR